MVLIASLLSTQRKRVGMKVSDLRIRDDGVYPLSGKIFSIRKGIEVGWGFYITMYPDSISIAPVFIQWSIEEETAFDSFVDL